MLEQVFENFGRNCIIFRDASAFASFSIDIVVKCLYKTFNGVCMLVIVDLPYFCWLIVVFTRFSCYFASFSLQLRFQVLLRLHGSPSRTGKVENDGRSFLVIPGCFLFVLLCSFLVFEIF